MSRLSLVAFALLLLLPACTRGGLPQNTPLSPRVCIENAAAAVGAINARAGTATWHVQPGSTECKTISLAAPNLELVAESIGGGMRGPVRYRATLRGMGESCWSWRLTDSSASQEDLVPCEQRRDGS